MRSAHPRLRSVKQHVMRHVMRRIGVRRTTAHFARRNRQRSDVPMEPIDPDKGILVVPTYDERENIARFLSCVLSTVPSLDVLVVDDNSPDGTADLVETQFGEDSRVHVLRREGVRGLGLSYVD